MLILMAFVDEVDGLVDGAVEFVVVIIELKGEDGEVGGKTEALAEDIV